MDNKKKLDFARQSALERADRETNSRRREVSDKYATEKLEASIGPEELEYDLKFLNNQELKERLEELNTLVEETAPLLSLNDHTPTFTEDFSRSLETLRQNKIEIKAINKELTQRGIDPSELQQTALETPAQAPDIGPASSFSSLLTERPTSPNPDVVSGKSPGGASQDTEAKGFNFSEYSEHSGLLTPSASPIIPSSNSPRGNSGPAVVKAIQKYTTDRTILTEAPIEINSPGGGVEESKGQEPTKSPRKRPSL